MTYFSTKKYSNTNSEAVKVANAKSGLSYNEVKNLLSEAKKTKSKND